MQQAECWVICNHQAGGAARLFPAHIDCATWVNKRQSNAPTQSHCRPITGRNISLNIWSKNEKRNIDDTTRSRARLRKVRHLPNYGIDGVKCGIVAPPPIPPHPPPPLHPPSTPLPSYEGNINVYKINVSLFWSTKMDGLNPKFISSFSFFNI